MALAPRKKISTANKTSFYLKDEEKVDDEGDNALPKFKRVATKIMMANRSFNLPRQRNISRVGLASQSQQSSRFTVRELVPKENTYRVEPDGKFMPEKTKNIMEKILKSRLEGRKYSRAEGKNLSVLLSDEIKATVKENALLDRHKFVSVVYIGQVLGQGVHITSRCLWNDKFDAFSSATFQNDTLFAQASIFAVYVE